MKKFTKACAVFLGLTAFSPLYPAGDVDVQDIQALRDWLNTKRQVTIREIGGNLSLSGEIRTEFQCTNEVSNGVRQRGPGGAVALTSTNSYDVEVNLMLDYRADRTWGAIKIEFDNDAGVINSSVNKIRIEKAYFGVKLYDGDLVSTDVEVGRRSLSTIFDSKVQFASMSDGVLLRYDVSVEHIGDLYIHALAEVVDEKIGQYAYFAELGWLTVMDTGLFLKYSVSDWDTKHHKNDITKWGYQYIVNQWTLGYKFIPEKFGRIVMPYMAFLWNPVASQTKITGGRKLNLAGYLGVSAGELRKKGDWAVDANYQAVQAQAVPSFDVSGVGIGNSSKAPFYSKNVDESKKSAAGNGNFRGFALTLDYLLTNNLNLQQQWLQSITLDTDIGPSRHFKQYEIELIYGF